MPDRTPFIEYRPADWGQNVTRRDPVKAYEAVITFLERCTDWDGTLPEGKLTVAAPGKYLPDGWTGDEATTAIERHLNAPTRPGIGHQSFNPSSGEFGPPSFDRDWDVPSSEHRWAVGLALAQPVALRDHPDPVHFMFSLDFRLVDPASGGVLPGQGGEAFGGRRSSLLAFVASGKSSCSVQLLFPFSEPGPSFLAYMAAIRPYLPFRLAKSAFRLMVPTKAKAMDKYKPRRISPDIFDR